MEKQQDEVLTKKVEGNASGDSSNSNKQKSEESEVHATKSKEENKKSKEEKGKKKDDKSAEHVLKSLNNLGTSEEKLGALCKKYTEIYDENKKINMQLKQTEKKCVALQREKEQLQSEQSKAILVRGRLENLCRELQKQNKAIKDESLSKIREEEEKRKVVSSKFQTALGEITALMQQNNENFSTLKEENLEIQNKFKTLCEQYELKEQQVEKMSKQMQLESQLADVKLAKVKIDMFAEKELLTNEKEQLLVELTAYQNKCQEMQKTEAALRNQITMYTKKYDEFQTALAKSHQIYSGFKSEIEKMSKKISRLEKETSIWKMKWEGSHKSLLQMATEKQQRDAELALTTRQLNQLQKLCRTLQSERTELINQLKNEGKTPKVEDTNTESSSIDLAPVGINNESQAQNEEENTNSILNKSVEKNNVSDATNNETSEDIVCEKVVENESESDHIKNHLGEVAATENKNTENKVELPGNAINDKLSEENTKPKSAELKQSEPANAALLKSDDGENGKKYRNCTKSPGCNESKKGKDGSRRKKK